MNRTIYLHKIINYITVIENTYILLFSGYLFSIIQSFTIIVYTRVAVTRLT